MTRHASYWQPHIDSGQMGIFGPVLNWDWRVRCARSRRDDQDCPHNDGQDARRVRAADADRRAAKPGSGFSTCRRKGTLTGHRLKGMGFEPNAESGWRARHWGLPLCSPLERGRGGGSRQERWAEGWEWIVSWMSMNRIDQNPGRGWGNSRRAQTNPVKVTAATASQPITPTARTHGEDPDNIRMRPAIPMANATYPTRRAQTAILQCPLCCSSGGSSMPGIIPGTWWFDHGHSPLILEGSPPK